MTAGSVVGSGPERDRSIPTVRSGRPQAGWPQHSLCSRATLSYNEPALAVRVGAGLTATKPHPCRSLQSPSGGLLQGPRCPTKTTVLFMQGYAVRCVDRAPPEL